MTGQLAIGAALCAGWPVCGQRGYDEAQRHARERAEVTGLRQRVRRGPYRDGYWVITSTSTSVRREGIGTRTRRGADGLTATSTTGRPA